jgi:hypothetical protein
MYKSIFSLLWLVVRMMYFFSLLCTKEWQQCNEQVKGDTSPSTIYGAEHLLCLFGIMLIIQLLWNETKLKEKAQLFHDSFCPMCFYGSLALLQLLSEQRGKYAHFVMQS